MTAILDFPLVDGIPVYPIYGASAPVQQTGYLSSGDLITETADGTDLNELWDEVASATAIYNEAMDRLISVLTFPVTVPVETVPQVGEISFEEATEYGIPQSAQLPIEMFQMGYDMRHYDKRNAYTWMFLADADARQIEAIHNEIIRADKRLLFKKVMEALFDNRLRRANIRNRPYNVYPLYNGDNGDGFIPPSYKGTTFTAAHTHYVISANTGIDSSDVEDLYNLVAEHGYGLEAGTEFMLLANKTETDKIRGWRRGVVSANGVTANYDFIPAPNQPPIILPNAEGLLGSQPASAFRGLPVIGSYGNINIVEEAYIPSAYLVLIGSGGAGSLQNPVGFREHANPQMRGLRILAGNQQRYPLIDGFYARAFGTGVRQRGGAAIMQIKASGPYDIPTKYKKGTGFLA